MKPTSWFIAACLISLLGLMLGTYGVLSHDIPAMALSLMCDVVDGKVARVGDVKGSRFGRMLDWHVDVALSHVGLMSLPLLNVNYLCAPLAVFQAFAIHNGWRVSGRAVIWAGVMLYGATHAQ